jgi:hypothetical protein
MENNLQMIISKILSALNEEDLRLIAGTEIEDLTQISEIGKIRATKLKESTTFLLQLKHLQLFKTDQVEDLERIVEIPAEEIKTAKKKVKKEKTKKKKPKKDKKKKGKKKTKK